MKMVICIFCGATAPLTDNDPPEGWDCKEERDLCPRCLGGIQRGVAAVKEGKVRPWSEVKRELGMEQDEPDD